MKKAVFPSVFLGAGLAANALLGPLVLNRIQFHVSPAAVTQLLGGEVVSLLLAAPMALIAGGLAWRGHRLWPVVAIGPALYSVYMNTQMVLGNEFTRYPGNSERFFALHLLLVVAGWLVAAFAWRALRQLQLPLLPRRIARPLALFILAISGMFLLAWAASISAVIRGEPPVGFADDVTLFWLVRFMDLGFVIPAGIATAYGLLLSRSWGTLAAYALIGVQLLLTAAVAGMAIVMTLRSDPGASRFFLVMTCIFALAFAAAYSQLVTNARLKAV